MLGMKNSLILFLSASIFYVLDNACILLHVPFSVHLDLDEYRLKGKKKKKKKNPISGWDSHFSWSGSKWLKWRSWAGQGDLLRAIWGPKHSAWERGWCLPCVTHLSWQCLFGISVSPARVSACISHPPPELWPGTVGASVEPDFQGLS